MIAGLLLVALAGFVALVWPWRSHLAAQPTSSTGSWPCAAPCSGRRLRACDSPRSSGN